MDGGRTSMLFREVNDRIDELLQSSGAEEEVDFLCECPSPRCVRALRLGRLEFERIRATGAFIVAPACARSAAAIERTANYVVVGAFFREAPAAGASRPGPPAAPAAPAAREARPPAAQGALPARRPPPPVAAGLAVL
jgi:hypothetical protein